MAPDGSLRVTVATANWGYMAPDGSVWVELTDGLTGNGVLNGYGNLRITRAEAFSGNGLYAPNGSFRVTGMSNLAAAIDFDNVALWTVSGTGGDATDNTFSASGSAVGALMVTPPLTIGVKYAYRVTYSITNGATFQIINGTGATVVIDSSAAPSGTLSGSFTATNANFRLRASAASTVTITELVLV